jgi:hypothetical protein
MAFRNLKDPGLRDIPGYSEFLNEPLDSPARTPPARFVPHQNNPLTVSEKRRW